MQAISDVCVDLVDGYILVDPCNYGEFNSEGIEMIACIPPRMGNGQDLMPRLIDVGKLSPLQLARIMETIRQQLEEEHPFAVCAILNSEADIDALAEHIAQFLIGPGPHGEKLLWRYFDPRVFVSTISIFSNVQREVLLGPIKTWKFIWFRQWWSVSSEQKKFNHLEISDTVWPSEKQWPAISQSRMLNRVLKKLYSEEKIGTELLLDSSRTASGYLVEGLSHLHLSEEEDRVEFAYLCTKYGVEYCQRQTFKKDLLALKNGQICWTELRNRMDQDKSGKFED